MITHEIASVAKQCRHYAMCKIDYLKTGLCPAGKEHGFVSHWPQGRMDIVRALAQGRLDYTEGLQCIADSCNLCGVCEKQCHFVTGLRPLSVMAALKEHVAELRQTAPHPATRIQDPLVTALAEALSLERVTSDPADLIAYADDPGPFSVPTPPRAVVLPRTVAEVQSVVRICRAHGVHWVTRGNGSSVMGFVLTPGVVIDTAFLREFRIDPARRTATVGAGISAYELQTEAAKHQLRANLAEPAALVCANLVCSGIFTTFSHAYGFAADNYISATFVGPEGESYTSDDPNAPNVFGYRRQDGLPISICVEVEFRLHPVSADEDALLVPCPTLEAGLALARELGERRIGVAVGVLGNEYLSVFLSASVNLAKRTKTLLEGTLGIGSAVLVIGDRFALRAVRELAPVVMDRHLLKTLVLGLPHLAQSPALALLEGYRGERPLYEALCQPELIGMLEAALDPSPRTFASQVDLELQDWYAELYSRPEMTDPVWLTACRILSSRMGREKHVFAVIFTAPMEPKVIVQITGNLREIGDRYQLAHDYGFATPLDLGNRAIVEYDYYFDHTDPAAAEAMRQAAGEIGALLETHEHEIAGVRWIRWWLGQGTARSAAILYR